MTKTTGPMLLETLRQAEVVRSIVIDTSRRQLEQVQQTLRTALATIAAVIAIAGLLFTNGVTLDPVPLIGMSGGVLLQTMASTILLRTGTTHGVSIMAGPDIATMAEAVGTGSVGPEDLYRRLADTFADDIDANRESVMILLARVKRGVNLLDAGVLLHLGSVGYIIGRSIIG